MTISKIFPYLSAQRPKILLIFGLFTLISSSLLLAFYDQILNFGLSTQLEIIEGTTMYDQFTNPTPEVLMKIWIWNVENADDFTRTTRRVSGKTRYNFTFPKPFVKQLGPFIFKEIRTIENLKYSNNNNFVQGLNTFKYKSIYDPNNPETGLDPFNHHVNIVNIVAVGMPSVIEHFTRNFPVIQGGPGLMCDFWIRYDFGSDQSLDPIRFLIRSDFRSDF